jgi:hypothetical protein
MDGITEEIARIREADDPGPSHAVAAAVMKRLYPQLVNLLRSRLPKGFGIESAESIATDRVVAFLEGKKIPDRVGNSRDLLFAMCREGVSRGFKSRKRLQSRGLDRGHSATKEQTTDVVAIGADEDSEQELSVEFKEIVDFACEDLEAVVDAKAVEIFLYAQLADEPPSQRGLMKIFNVGPSKAALAVDYGAVCLHRRYGCGRGRIVELLVEECHRNAEEVRGWLAELDRRRPIPGSNHRSPVETEHASGD